MTFLTFILPDDMKNGILNLPDSTLSLSNCKVDPSNGKAPQTSTYSTTPRLWKLSNEILGFNFYSVLHTHTSISGPRYLAPSNTSGAA